TENLLVQQMVMAAWRLQRVRTLETGLFNIRMVDLAQAREAPTLNCRKPSVRPLHSSRITAAAAPSRNSPATKPASSGPSIEPFANSNAFARTVGQAFSPSARRRNRPRQFPPSPFRLLAPPNFPPLKVI